MRRTEFTSWLSPYFQKYVVLKQASGWDYSTQAGLLADFDRYLEACDANAPLTTDFLRDYLATLSRLSPRGRDNLVSAVWQALAYARRHGAPIGRLPDRPRLAPAGYRLREPFILSFPQVERLLAATLELAPRRPFARVTHTTFLGLLYTSGLRISEALALDVGDFDSKQKTLLVRGGKFKKDRLLPIRTSTVHALAGYVADPLRPLARTPNAPFFVSRRKRRLEESSPRHMLRKAARLADVEDGDRLPRPHDLRHTFAVHRVVTWYRAGRDVNALLPALSTYMGHVSTAHTYTYLRSAELLFGEAAPRFELLASQAQDGRSS